MNPPNAPSPAAAVVARFIEAINRHDVGALMDLLTDDHRFIDSSGSVVTGTETLRGAWNDYFVWFPNYEVAVKTTMTDGDTVALFGQAGGTFSRGRGTVGDNTWLVPAAWRAVVREGRIATWQVYCDTEPVLAIMLRAHEAAKDEG
jgi:ketosteroid isomerase-like protein